MEKINHAFTVKSLYLQTPRWAKNMFRITLLVTSALTIFIAGTNIIDENIKLEIVLGLKALDAFMFGLSKMFGFEYEENK